MDAPWKELLAGERLPAAVIDLDAVEHNARHLLDALGDARTVAGEAVTLRIASKSVRHPWLLRHLVGLDARMRGLMCYSPHEAALLADQGFDDLLVAYPIARPVDAEAVATLVARGVRVRQVIDAVDPVQLLENAARKHGVTIEACLDVDASWRPLPGLHLGVRRSPIRSVAEAYPVARAVKSASHVRLTAVMAYEAQVAGLADRASNPVTRAGIALIKSRSRLLAAARRREIVDALRADGHAIDLVNGGGTGSLATTAHDGTVTEVTAGSGFLAPHLFDGYSDLALRPAAFIALAVVRRSDPDHVTCAGGGIIASGATGADRSPVVHWPTNLAPVPMEGWGEVQTPLRVTGGEPPALGDPVLARPAKAGEWLERFAEVLLVRDGRIVGREPTYRGLGRCFG